MSEASASARSIAPPSAATPVSRRADLTTPLHLFRDCSSTPEQHARSQTRTSVAHSVGPLPLRQDLTTRVILGKPAPGQAARGSFATILSAESSRAEVPPPFHKQTRQRNAFHRTTL